MKYLKRASIVLAMVVCMSQVAAAQHDAQQAADEATQASDDLTIASDTYNNKTLVAIGYLNTDLVNYHALPMPGWPSGWVTAYTTLVNAFNADRNTALGFHGQGNAALATANMAMTNGTNAFNAGNYESAWEFYGQADSAYISANAAFANAALWYAVADKDCKDCNNYYTSHGG